MNTNSPCIGKCVLDTTRQFCIGCKRTIEQITKRGAYATKESQELDKATKD